MSKESLKKVTMFLPLDLVNRATKVSKKSLTETVRQGLKLVATANTYDRLLAYRGKVDLALDLEALREDL